MATSGTCALTASLFSKRSELETSIERLMKSPTARNDSTTSEEQMIQQSSSNEEEFACLSDGCDHVYHSQKKMQSHFMRRHPNRAADIADLLVFLEEGEPLPVLKYDEDEASTSSSSEEGTEDEKDEKHTKEDEETTLVEKPATKTTIKTEEVSKDVKQVPPMIDYICDRCGVEFYSSRYLEIHMRSHLIRRQFMCNLCPGKFAFRINLLEHIQAQHNIDLLLQNHERKAVQRSRSNGGRCYGRSNGLTGRLSII